MNQVRDVMTRKVLTIDPDASLDDVAWGLTKRGISGAPVKDKHGNVIGILSKSDLAASRRITADCPDARVDDAMTPVLFAAKEDDPIRFAAQRMVSTGTHRLVVLDNSGGVVGIITPGDILRGLLDGRVTSAAFAD